MIYLDGREIAGLLTYNVLRQALAEVLSRDATVPQRTSYEVQPDRFLGLMPAWYSNSSISVKLVMVAPLNATRDLPTAQALVVLFDGQTGQPKAVLDGTEITLRRTAAASALAASLLSREHSSKYSLLGCGALALPMVEAMAEVRPIREVRIWGRSFHKAETAASQVAARFTQLTVQAVADPERAASWADIVSTITRSPDPILCGTWITPGAHIDLVGSHSPTARELDDNGIRKARVFVDFSASAMAEAGDVLIPISTGAITRKHIMGELRDLLNGSVKGRTAPDEITVFKSVGNGLEDLAAAETVLRLLSATQA